MSHFGDRSAHNMMPNPPRTTTISYIPPSSEEDPVSISVKCQEMVDFSTYSLPFLAIALISLIVGFVYAFFGYRLYKVLLFLIGQFFGFVLVYLVCTEQRLMPPSGNLFLALVVGFLVGLITLLAEYVGLFMTGFLTGQLVGAAVLLFLHGFTLLPPSYGVWPTIGIQFVFGLFFAQLTLLSQRLLLIFDSSLIGGALVASGMDYFGQQWAGIRLIWLALNARLPLFNTICWYSWTMIGLWPLVTVTGVMVQHKLTTMEYKHSGPDLFSREEYSHSSSEQLTTRIDCNPTGTTEEASNNHHRRRPVSTVKNTKYKSAPNDVEKSEPEQEYIARSFRSLYRARRNQGDVICQSYIDSLRRENAERSTITCNDSTTMTDLATTFPKETSQMP